MLSLSYKKGGKMVQKFVFKDIEHLKNINSNEEMKAERERFRLKLEELKKSLNQEERLELEKCYLPRVAGIRCFNLDFEFFKIQKAFIDIFKKSIYEDDGYIDFLDVYIYGKTVQRKIELFVSDEAPETARKKIRENEYSLLFYFDGGKKLKYLRSERKKKYV